MRRRSSINLALGLALTLTACGSDRDEDLGGGIYPGGPEDDGSDGDDGDPTDEGEPEEGENTGDDGGDDPPDSDPPGGGDDTGDDGGTDVPEDPPAGEPPECEPLWQYYGMGYIRQDPPTTAEEMFCYVLGQRISYATHTREPECYDEWEAHDGPPPVSWPYEMEYDVTLMADAQVEAERIAAGGAPNGGKTDNGWDLPIYVDGCASSEYTVTSIDDRIEDWTPAEGEPYAGLAKSNGRARLSLYYYDPGPGYPVLTRMGTGMVDQNGNRTWVIVLR
jgi:hypothetical protein